MSAGAPCQYLPWDSRFFGQRIGRVTASRLTSSQLFDILVWCEQNQIACLYFLADADHPQTHRLAEQADFKLVDIRLTFQRSISTIAKHHKPPPQDTLRPQFPTPGAGTVSLFTIRPAIEDDILALEDLASENLQATRFFADPCFSRNACRRLYRTWIRNSVQGYADHVLVLETSGKPHGFITCHLKSLDGKGSIGLITVGNKIQGQGAGQTLVAKALAWFVSQKAFEINVVTQGRNLAAQRLYERCGFLTHSVQLWYHKWFVDCP